jgi:hypothetical protein
MALSPFTALLQFFRPWQLLFASGLARRGSVLFLSQARRCQIEDDGLKACHLIDAVADTFSPQAGLFYSSEWEVANPMRWTVVDSDLSAL